MACENPRTVYRASNGGPLYFNKPHKHAHYDKFTIPCGTCILCREEQARQAAVRIYHEEQNHKISSFVTLSYNNKHLPEHGGLRYADLVKFWKRARKTYGKMRYYAVGEYGDESQRPHYHACIFGHAFADDRIIVETTPHLLWTSPKLEKCWGLGQVRIGALTFATAKYTASYVTKKLRSKQKYVRVDEETGELIPLEQPRAFMSRNLAKAWWEANYNYVTAHDHVIIDGRRQKPPRAYDRWLAAKSEIAREMVTKQRTKHIEEKTSEQNRARARNAHARAKQKPKKL